MYFRKSERVVLEELKKYMKRTEEGIRIQMVTKRIRVYGIVQGVGFRPTVSRHAATAGITGSVCNKGPYVEIFAQGEEKCVKDFLERLEKKPPKRAAILKINVEDLKEAGTGERCEENGREKNIPEMDDNKAAENVIKKKIVVYKDFQIIESEKTKGEIFVSPDIAICDECKKEMYDPEDRRYLHPFINCTCCGPRLTILDALPYDRERTSMKEFPMCPECAEEYEDPATRRYDAQPVCCNACGPEVYLIGRKERRREAITKVRQTIKNGGIVAIKGIGGFHLCCDATNEAAVGRLRTLKKRPAKPFAVMARNAEVVKKECLVNEEQEAVLDGHQKPILLLTKRERVRSVERETVEKGRQRLCASIAPGNPKVGVMLPYAPVQLLLFDYDDGIEMPDFLVMTSGNTSGAPICRDDKDAVEELSHLCDLILSHDRKIRIRADDSVMDFYKGEPYMIRRSRGYAPLPSMVSMPWKGQVLAVGGELKNTFCIGVDGRFYSSPYVGDLEDLRTVEALKETIHRFQTLLEVEPEVAACDLHPKYNSTVVAEELGLPVIKIQHHYAHILSCMAENDWKEPVIGVAFDGTGYGTDGTIWGGEILFADYETFERVGSIQPFLQIGGDLSAKEGWRIAVPLIYQQIRDKRKTMEIVRNLDLCSEAECKVLLTMADKKLNAVTSTSAGRLFDAVSAILGIRKKSTFEGEASMALEFAAEAYEEMYICGRESMVANNDADSIHIDNNVVNESTLAASGMDCQIWTMNTGDLIAYLTKKKLEDTDTKELAYIFHKKLAELVTEGCKHTREKTKCSCVALSGGVFQNRLLLKLVEEGLEREGFKVLRHHLIPPNDGGIALGQAAYAMQYIRRK